MLHVLWFHAMRMYKNDKKNLHDSFALPPRSLLIFSELNVLKVGCWFVESRMLEHNNLAPGNVIIIIVIIIVHEVFSSLTQSNKTVIFFRMILLYEGRCGRLA